MSFSSSYSFSSSSAWPWKSIAQYAGLAAAVGLVFYLTSERRPRRRTLKREELVNILLDLSKDMYVVFTDLAQVSQSIHRQLVSKGLDKQLDSEQLEGMLMMQGMQQKFKDTQLAVFDRHKVSEGDVETATKKHEDDPEVQKYVKGLKVMYSEAIKGDLPMFPGLQLPDTLTKDKYFEILEDINNEKLKRFRPILSEMRSDSSKATSPASREAGALPSSELTMKLKDASEAVEAEMIVKHAAVLGEKMMFAAANAAFSKDADFRKRRSDVDAAHQERIVNLMKTISAGGGGGGTGSSSSAAKG
ncbi:unnamed protein product [Vitrella brassicaformis CCMP3155]|uniref:Uncharacterized protein n=1 Tax=Vitrella brassicaformis (strain CCMP3155) TaxID=1169540 RepID=A0A0G4EGS8_VITBC|nr:unnamed protein product [Vitrella brassicaformis CCMP3155]|eukprot:CEL95452.1 unnamed protein product [Vitrella brassicaformis CCMP3155]